MRSSVILDSPSVKACLWLIVPLFFLPKINLISMGGTETAGVRIDDILLFGFSLFFLFASLSLRKPLHFVEKALFALIALSLFSFAFNRLLLYLDVINVSSSILYALRPLEYFLFFYIGQMAFPRLHLSTLMLLFLGWNALIMTLQWIGILPAVSVDGFMYVSGRIPGIASFPSEMGALLNLLFCYFLFSGFLDELKEGFLKESLPYVLFFCIGALVLWTASRASLVAHILAFIFYLKVCGASRKTARAALGLLLLGIGGVLLALILPHIDELYERSFALFSWDNLDLIEEVWHRIETSYNPLGNETVEYDEGYDMSWWMRIHKWCYALKVFVLNPECYLQGIGPGFASAGLDGGLLRIFVELGFIGAFLYIVFFKGLMSLSPYLKWMVISLLLNMIFFDAHLAYKPMSLIFFAAGYALAERENKDTLPELSLVS